MSEIDQAYSELLERLGTSRADGYTHRQAEIVTQWQGKIERQGNVCYSALRYALRCARESEKTLAMWQLDELYEIGVKAHDTHRTAKRMYNSG